MQYQHRFRVRAPVARVAAFHLRADSLAAITPPLIMMRVHNSPTELASGDEFDFTMWMGPVPIRWVARIDDVGPTGFRDVQTRGPFQSWEHRHEFVRLDADTTFVIDTIRYRLRVHPVWGPFGLAMAGGLPVLFKYRGWKTRRLLEENVSG